MWNKLRAHSGVWLGVLIFAAIVFLGQLWYVYQRHEATAYISTETCMFGSTTDAIRPCNQSGSMVLSRYLLGIGVHFSYGGNLSSCNPYSGNVISLPFIHFVFNKQQSSLSANYCQGVY